MTKAVFNKKENLSTSKSDLNWRKQLLHCCTWSTICIVLKPGHFGK